MFQDFTEHFLVTFLLFALSDWVCDMYIQHVWCFTLFYSNIHNRLFLAPTCPVNLLIASEYYKRISNDFVFKYLKLFSKYHEVQVYLKNLRFTSVQYLIDYT